MTTKNFEHIWNNTNPVDPLLFEEDDNSKKDYWISDDDIPWANNLISWIAEFINRLI